MAGRATRPGTGTPPAASGPRPETDAALLNRARRGDTQAFAELMRGHQGRIYGLTLRFVAESGGAEELTQDTFLRAWQGLEGFRGEASVGTWLHRIAVNLCRDHVGSRQVRQRHRETELSDADGGPETRIPGPPRPDERLAEKETAQALRRAVAELDPAHRAAFLLRHQEGRSPVEIAQALGISEANAKVRVHRARWRILATLRRLGCEV